MTLFWLGALFGVLCTWAGILVFLWTEERRRRRYSRTFKPVRPSRKF